MSDIGSWIPDTTLDLRNLLATETHIARIILDQIQQQRGCFVLALVREGTNCCDRLCKQPGHQGQFKAGSGERLDASHASHASLPARHIDALSLGLHNHRDTNVIM